MTNKYIIGLNGDAFRYLLVGAVVFLIYFVLLFLLIDVMRVYYPIGVSVSYVLAVSVQLTLNKVFTFDGGVGSTKSQLIKYLCLLVINYLATISVVAFVVERMFFSAYTGAAIGVVTTILIGYFASKFWIFRK